MVYIYFIKNTTTNNYKIGKSYNPTNRLKQLQTGNDCKLEIYHIFESDNAKLESYLHQYFKNNKILGEWFEISDSDIDNVIKIISMKTDINQLTYKQLQLLAKIHNIRANCGKQNIIENINKINSSEEINNKFVKGNTEGCVIL